MIRRPSLGTVEQSVPGVQMRHRRLFRQRGSGRERSRGTAIVEAALVAPVFFIMVFGIIEMGFLYRDYLTTTTATADAARIGGIVGPDVIAVTTSDPVTADFEVIKALREGLSGLDSTSIQRIVVFKANGTSTSATDQIPAACKNGVALANRCNVYNPNTAFLQIQAGNAAYFNCATNPTGPACTWNPTSRSDGPDPTWIDYLGVYVLINRPSLTGFFQSRYTISEAAIVRLEPGETDI